MTESKALTTLALSFFDNVYGPDSNEILTWTDTEIKVHPLVEAFQNTGDSLMVVTVGDQATPEDATVSLQLPEITEVTPPTLSTLGGHHSWALLHGPPVAA